MPVLPGMGHIIAGVHAPNLRFVGGYAVGFAGTVSDTTVTLGSLTGGLAVTPAAGDLVILVFAAAEALTGDHNMTVTTAGYTELADLYIEDTLGTNLGVFWKRMGSTPDTSVDVGGTGGSDNAGAVAVHVWRGAHSVTPIDVTTTTATGVSSSLANPASITPTTFGSVILIAAGSGHADGTQTFTHGTFGNLATVGQNDVYDVTVGIASYQAWLTGAYDPAAFGYSTTDDASNSWAAATIAIRPA